MEIQIFDDSLEKIPQKEINNALTKLKHLTGS